MKSLWLTYSWIDNDDGDFDFLVQQLTSAGIQVTYDKISLIPGRRLWEQIDARISSDSISGWAYLITASSLSSPACREELSYALQRALEVKGEEFPLIGLLHGVSIRDVPTALRIRLCVNLAGTDWIEEIRAGVNNQPPRREIPSQNELVIKFHPKYGGENRFAIEVRPRFGELRYWRLAFPSKGIQPIAYGCGPANGGGIGGAPRDVIEGEYHDLGGEAMKVVGTGDPINPTTSTYAIFEGSLPERFFFGISRDANSLEVNGQIVQIEKRN